MEKKPQESNNKPRFLYVILLLLAGICGFLIWQNMQLKRLIEQNGVTITEISGEKESIKAELESMLEQYNALETENDSLNADLEAEKEKIEALLKKIKNKDWSIHKLKKETESLRTIMKGYVAQIDSLNTVNNNLQIENRSVKTALNSEKGKNETLAKENEGLNDQLNIAAQLKAINLRSYGVKVKGNNTGKESDRAKRIDKIRTEFTILQNKVTPPGNKWIYLRILSPDGRVLTQKTEDNSQFTFNGVTGLYSVKKQINYQNETTNLKMDWNKTDEFAIGEYTVEIYSDGVDIGRTKVLLK